MDDVADRVRIDKWLWAARFFKTRSLAAQAIEAGRVRMNGDRIKPAKDVKCGDEIAVRIDALEWVVEVRGSPRAAGRRKRRASSTPSARRAWRGGWRRSMRASSAGAGVRAARAADQARPAPAQAVAGG